MFYNLFKRCVYFGGLFLGLSLTWAENSCYQAGRNTSLCLEMKYVRSLLNILESQPDLMQNNFQLIERGSRDMTQTLNSILVRNSTNSHLQFFQELRNKTLLLASQAQKHSLDVHKSIVTLKETCQKCHASASENTSVKWDEIASGSWTKQVEICLSQGRNPYLCRNMLGVLTGINYFLASQDSARTSYEMSFEVAKEIYRISENLESLSAHHEGEAGFGAIKLQAWELMTMAQEKKPDLFQKVRETQQICLKCHGERQ